MYSTRGAYCLTALLLFVNTPQPGITDQRFIRRSAQDVVRIGERLVVLSSGDGSILELEFPSMQLLEHLHGAFSSEDRLAGLAPADDGWLWLLKGRVGAAGSSRIELGAAHEAEVLL